MICKTNGDWYGDTNAFSEGQIAINIYGCDKI